LGNASWIPMATLPNISVSADIATSSLALVSATDDRILAIIKDYPNLGVYLRKFRDEFGVKRVPGVILFKKDRPERHRSFEAVAGFRDAIAASVIPFAWSHALCYENYSNIRYADWFSFYPWNLDRNYEYVVIWSPTQLGLHEVDLLRAQSSPGISHMEVSDSDIDQPVLKALLNRWESRFST
jgi:hypothetical protein